jgi:hypothetical protein
MQGKILAYEKPKHDKHTKENTTHRILHTKVWQDKNNFIPKNILMHNPQRDKALSTSKKEVRNDGIIIEPYL